LVLVRQLRSVSALVPWCLSTLGFVAGGLGLVAGTVLWLTTPAPEARRSAGREIMVALLVGRAL
jgi:hypothetical protein